MPNKLIGTEGNQVPSNADLGSSAYMDKNEFVLSRGGFTSQIKSKIPNTAVDVLVYDTAMDSDGGAWRKRMQDASWYNEELNTHARGKTKEFPSKAVIVAEDRTITIYDGDDPDLPMWMKFISTGTNAGFLPYLNVTYSSTFVRRVAMVNGLLAIAVEGSVGGLMLIDFVLDEARIIYNSSIDERRFTCGIDRRNHHYKVELTKSRYNRHIVNRVVHDVDVAVLPNASFDYDRGLPTVSIAAATDAGVTVFKDKGEGIDITVSNASYTESNKVEFLPGGGIGLSLENSNPSAEDSYYVFHKVPDANASITVDSKDASYRDVDAFYAGQYTNQNNVDIFINSYDNDREIKCANRLNFGTPYGLTRVQQDVGYPNQGLSAFIASDYNTGWMPGECKYATLSSTDNVDIVGVELAPQNAATSDDDSGEANATTGWTAYNGATISSVNTYANGLNSTYSLYVNLNGGGSRGAYFTANVKAGVTYTISFDVYHTNASGGNVTQLEIGTSPDGNQFGDFVFPVVNDWQSNSHSFTATSDDTLYFLFREAGSTNPDFWLDNVSLRVSEACHQAREAAIHRHGQAQIIGTIKKTPVAGNADLVSYSGFDNNNYLRIPYWKNSSGHGGAHTTSSNQAFSYVYWFKDNGNSTPQNWQAHVINGFYDGSWRYYVEIGTNGSKAGFAFSDGNGNGQGLSSTNNIDNNDWHCHVITYDGNRVKMYLNGEFENEMRVNINITDIRGHIRIGNNHNNGNEPSPASELALIRYGWTNLSEEKIKKIYNDEKLLFREGAKAALYGSSNSANTVCVDPVTDLLHVGTNSARSVFRGLTRIENTTEPVSQKISVVNNFVVEE
jgi:hypothetical protein